MALFGNPSLGGQSFSDQLALLGASLRDDPNALVNMRSLIANRQMQQGRLALASNVLGYGAQAPDGGGGTQAPAAQPQAQDATSAPNAPGGDATAPAPAPISPDALAAAPRTAPVAGSQSPLARAVASGDPAQIARLQVGLKLAGVDADLAPYLPDYKEANGVLYDSKTGRQLSGEVGTQLAVAPSGMAYDVHDASMRGRQGLGAPPVAGYVPQYDPNTGNFAGWADPGNTVAAAKQASTAAEAAGTASVGTAPVPGYVRRFDPITGAPRWVDPSNSVADATTAQEDARNRSRAAYTPSTWEDSSGSTHTGSQLDAVGGGPSFQPRPAGGKAPSATFNLPAQGSGPDRAGPSAAGKTYMAAQGGDLAKALDGYRNNLPQITQRVAAINKMIQLVNQGVGQGGLNPGGMEVSNALASLGISSAKNNNAQVFSSLGATLNKGIAAGAGFSIRSQREFQSFIKSNPTLSNTKQGQLSILSNLAQNAALDQKEAQAAVNFAAKAGPQGLAGTITDKNGRVWNWDQARQELYRRNPLHY